MGDIPGALGRRRPSPLNLESSLLASGVSPSFGSTAPPAYRRKLNVQGLPDGVRRTDRGRPQDYCEEVQNSISKHAQLCRREGCTRCQYREQRARQEISDAQLSGLESKTRGRNQVDLHTFSSGRPTPQEVVDRGETLMHPKNFYDVKKCRALFGMGPQPVCEYSSGGPRLDTKAFMRRPGQILYDHQIADTTHRLRLASAEAMTNAGHGKVNPHGDLVLFQEEVDKAADANSVHHSKPVMATSKAHRYKNALNFIKELENRKHEEQGNAIESFRGNPMNDKSMQLNVQNLLTALGGSGLGHVVLRKQAARIVERLREFAFQWESQPHSDRRRRRSTGAELRRRSMGSSSPRRSIGLESRLGFFTGLTSNVPSEEEEINTKREPGTDFKLVDWRRATEHCCVLVEGLPISAGEDKQWTLVLHDLLQQDWPWERPRPNTLDDYGKSAELAGDKDLGLLSFTLCVENVSYENVLRHHAIVAFGQALQRAVVKDVKANTCPESYFRGMSVTNVYVTISGGPSVVRGSFLVSPADGTTLSSLYSVMRVSNSFRQTVARELKNELDLIDLVGECVVDRVNDLAKVEPLFMGLLLGITTKPYRLGPLEWETTLSGIRTVDGQVLHRGREHELFSDLDLDLQGSIQAREFKQVYTQRRPDETFGKIMAAKRIADNGINHDDFRVALRNKTINGMDFRCPMFDTHTGLAAHRIPCKCCAHTPEDVAPEVWYPSHTPDVNNDGTEKPLCRKPFPQRNTEVRVTLRLDRTKRGITAVEDGGYHSRLWMQLEDEEPQVLIDDMQLEAADIAFPAVYASHPPVDIHTAVKIEAGQPSWQTAAEKFNLSETAFAEIALDVNEAVRNRSQMHDEDGDEMFRRMMSTLWASRAEPKDEGDNCRRTRVVEPPDGVRPVPTTFQDWWNWLLKKLQMDQMRGPAPVFVSRLLVHFLRGILLKECNGKASETASIGVDEVDAKFDETWGWIRRKSMYSSPQQFDEHEGWNLNFQTLLKLTGYGNNPIGFLTAHCAQGMKWRNIVHYDPNSQQLSLMSDNTADH